MNHTPELFTVDKSPCVLLRRVELPWPPTVNHYWRTVKIGRKTQTIVSEKARKYRDVVIAELMLRRFHTLRLADRLSVEIVLHPPTKARRDLDNFAKGLLDACTHAGVWLDDEQIDDLRILRGDVRKGGCAVVTIRVTSDN